MADLIWTDTLSAPKSLATRGDTAVAIIEDPGVLDIRPMAAGLERLYSEVLGVSLPSDPWSVVTGDAFRIAWIGPRRWRLIGDRDNVRPLLAPLIERHGPAPVFDLTGAFGCFRIVGVTSHEILMRLCPLDLRGIEPDQARGTSLAGVPSLLIREGAHNSWIALTPRSFVAYVADALVEAARTPGRLALFEPAEPPQV